LSFKELIIFKYLLPNKTNIILFVSDLNTVVSIRSTSITEVLQIVDTSLESIVVDSISTVSMLTVLIESMVLGNTSLLIKYVKFIGLSYNTSFSYSLVRINESKNLSSVLYLINF
jgi:hypothetical protein